MSQKLTQDMVIRSEEELQGILDTFRYDPAIGVIYYKVDRGFRKSGDMAGGVSKRGYKRLKLSGKHYAYHHVCWFLHYGEWPNRNIDHADRDPLNNTIGNLREATLSEQQSNARGWGSCSHKGVCYHKYHKRWMAYINKDGVRHNLGYFPTEVDAAKAVDAKAKELYGEYAYENLTFDVNTYTMTPDLGPVEPHVKLVKGDPF